MAKVLDSAVDLWHEANNGKHAHPRVGLIRAQLDSRALNRGNEVKDKSTQIRNTVQLY